MPVQLTEGLLTVAEYHRLAAAGILSWEDRVELLNGKVIPMSPIGSAHAACVEKISELLRLVLGEKAMVRAQNPVTLGNYSEPEPDLAIVARKDNFYADRHPAPHEIFLIIEVADSTLQKDRLEKLPLYAAAGIPEYWIANLEKQELEVYRLPDSDQFLSKTILRRGEEVSFNRFGASFQVNDLL